MVFEYKNYKCNSKIYYSGFRVVFCFVIIFSVVFFRCSKNASKQSYLKDSNGIYFKLLAIGDGIEKPTINNVLQIDAELRTQSDSVFFSSIHSTKNGLFVQLNKSLISANFNHYFFKMVEGDSASFLISPELFFNSFFDTLVPAFCKNDSLIKFNFKIKAVINNEFYNKQLTSEAEDKELLELKIIDEFLKVNYPTAQADKFGIYKLEKKETQLRKPELGNKITVQYQGFFIDGNSLDSSPQQIEFVYGTPDQLIKGLNIVIGTLKKGEFSKIIVPSRLAFGEIGSSNQQVQPYTPLVYNITLIDIK